MRRLWELRRQSHVPDSVWSEFHEISKTTRQIFSAPLGEPEATVWFNAIEREPFEDHPAIALPAPMELDVRLGDALQSRKSSREFKQHALSAAQISTLLDSAYGTGGSLGQSAVRHAVPSAGGMYPLSIFVALAPGNEIAGGLHAYVPHRHCLVRLTDEAAWEEVADCCLEPDLARSAAAIVIVAATFEVTTYKYGERGYRFILIEAGHAGQNIQLAGTALGLQSLPYGGFVDRELDGILGLDGVQASNVYTLMIGG